jgi:predicted anti-sigma-YlaC factor YlaD
MKDPCSELREKLSDFLEPSELEELCKTVGQHLDACRDCRLEVDSVKKTITIVRSRNDVEAPVWVSDQLSSLLAREYESGEGGTSSD